MGLVPHCFADFMSAGNVPSSRLHIGQCLLGCFAQARNVPQLGHVTFQSFELSSDIPVLSIAEVGHELFAALSNLLVGHQSTTSFFVTVCIHVRVGLQVDTGAEVEVPHGEAKVPTTPQLAFNSPGHGRGPVLVESHVGRIGIASLAARPGPL